MSFRVHIPSSRYFSFSLVFFCSYFVPPVHISVAICNDRRRHLHSTLHVPSVYSRKTCNQGDQSIYIQIPFLPENSRRMQGWMQTLPTIDPPTSLRKYEGTFKEETKWVQQPRSRKRARRIRNNNCAISLICHAAFMSCSVLWWRGFVKRSQLTVSLKRKAFDH